MDEGFVKRQFRGIQDGLRHSVEALEGYSRWLKAFCRVT